MRRCVVVLMDPPLPGVGSAMKDFFFRLFFFADTGGAPFGREERPDGRFAFPPSFLRRRHLTEVFQNDRRGNNPATSTTAAGGTPP